MDDMDDTVIARAREQHRATAMRLVIDHDVIAPREQQPPTCTW
jgi:hypothetical protein